MKKLQITTQQIQLVKASFQKVQNFGLEIICSKTFNQMFENYPLCREAYKDQIKESEFQMKFKQSSMELSKIIENAVIKIDELFNNQDQYKQILGCSFSNGLSIIVKQQGFHRIYFENLDSCLQGQISLDCREALKVLLMFIFDAIKFNTIIIEPQIQIQQTLKGQSIETEIIQSLAEEIKKENDELSQIENEDQIGQFENTEQQQISELQLILKEQCYVRQTNIKEFLQLNTIVSILFLIYQIDCFFINQKIQQLDNEQELGNLINNLQITFLTLIYIGLNIAAYKWYQADFIYRQIIKDYQYYSDIFEKSQSTAAKICSNNQTPKFEKKESQMNLTEQRKNEPEKIQVIKRETDTFPKRKSSYFSRQHLRENNYQKVANEQQNQNSKCVQPSLIKYQKANFILARTSKMDQYVRPVNQSKYEQSILRSNFDFSMLTLYLVFTICVGTNIKKYIRDHQVHDQSAHYFYFQTFLVAQIIFISQKQILDYLQFDINQVQKNISKNKDLNASTLVQNISFKQTILKFSIFISSQIYIISQIMYGNPYTIQKDSNLYVCICIIILMAFFGYLFIYIGQNEKMKIKEAFKVHETRNFEKVWQNTVSQHIQSGIVFYTQNQGVISVNQKFREIVGIPNNLSKTQTIEEIQQQQKALLNNVQKTSFGGYQFPRQDNISEGSQMNIAQNSKQSQDNLDISISQKLQENLFNLSWYFNQHFHWNTNQKQNSKKNINGLIINQNQKFKVNKFNFYACKNNQNEDNKDHNEDIDWSQILVKPKLVKLYNENAQEEQPPQQNDLSNKQLSESQNQKTLLGNIQMNQFNRDQQINNQDLSPHNNLQTPNFGKKFIQKTQIIKNNLINFDEAQSAVKVKIRIPILEIFYELSQKCLEKYKICQMMLSEQETTKEQDNLYSQVQNENMRSQISCVSECYKVIKTKNIIRIVTQAYLIRGKAYYIFSIEGDIRAKQELQNQMETRKQDLLQLASILHDLKTPLNCISGTSQILRAFVESDQPALMPYLKNFDLSLEFIFAMIEDIQDLAKFSGSQNFSLTNEFFEVRSFLKDVLILFEQQCAFKNIELKRYVDDNVPSKIYSDQKRIKQILMNMISNALKFTTKGFIMVSFSIIEDEVEVSNDQQINGSDLQQENKSEQNTTIDALKKSDSQVAPKEKQNEDNLQLQSQDQSIQDIQANQKQKIKKRMMITIEDTGLGIKKDDLQKLFKYFGKLKDKKKINQKGTGLGLNISRRIVEAMGGTIGVESEYKQGTKFTMIVNIQVKPGDQFQNKKLINDSTDQNINIVNQKNPNAPVLKLSDQNLQKKVIQKYQIAQKLSTIVEENVINNSNKIQKENDQEYQEQIDKIQNYQESMKSKRRQSRPQNDQRSSFLKIESNKKDNLKVEENGSNKISSYNISIYSNSDATIQDQKQFGNQNSNQNFQNSMDRDDSQIKKKQKKLSTFTPGYKIDKAQLKYSDRNPSSKLQDIKQYFCKPINEMNTSKNLFSKELFQIDVNNIKQNFTTEENPISKRSNVQEEKKSEKKKIDKILRGESVQSDLKKGQTKKVNRRKINMIKSNDSKAISIPLQNIEAGDNPKIRAKSIANNVFKFRSRLSKEQSKQSSEDKMQKIIPKSKQSSKQIMDQNEKKK